MNLNSVIDFANSAVNKVGRYRIDFTLSQPALMAESYVIEALNWDSISYGDEEIEKVPADKRGIYAFVICNNNLILPPHGYIVYIGIAGHNSKRTLRERYKDYLNETTVLKRDRIAFMIGNWRHVLRFYFAPIDDDISTEDLQKLEIQLNTALMPPFSVRDLEADTRRMQRAFR